MFIVSLDSWKKYIEEMPFAKKTGIKVVAFEPFKCILSLPFDPTNENPMGSLHPGAPFVLAELAGASILSASLDKSKYQIINKTVFIRFKKPCMGDIFAKLEMTSEEVKKIEKAVAVNGKTDVPVKIPVTDEAGNVLVEAESIYHVRPMPQ